MLPLRFYFMDVTPRRAGAAFRLFFSLRWRQMPPLSSFAIFRRFRFEISLPRPPMRFMASAMSALEC